MKKEKGGCEPPNNQMNTDILPRPSRAAYRTSPIKRTRRTKAQLDAVLSAAQEIIDGEEYAITIRHLFYRLATQKVIEKTEADYKRLCSHLSKWRRSGEIAWDSFADNTRWRIGEDTFGGMEDALKNTATAYRRNLWAEQPAYVEIWVEKDAIASIVSDAADSFGVKTFICRGFASLSSLYQAAEIFKAVQERGKEIFIYYFGDHDPSGLAIDDQITNALADDFGVEVNFERAAVTVEQISEYELPTRPVKKSDRRAKDWEGECVEIDALSSRILKQLVEDCITRHIEPGAWERTKDLERLERETLTTLASNFGRAA